MRIFGFRWILLLILGALVPPLSGAAEPAQQPAPPAAPVARSADGKNGESVPKAPAARDPALDRYWQAVKIFRDGKPPEWEKGRALLQEAADAENTTAQNYLATCYLSGAHGFRKDARKAVNWFRLAAGRGNAFAKVNLAYCYFDGVGVKKDHVQAADLLTAAVAADADYSAPEPPADFFAKPDQKPGGAESTLSGDLPANPADQTRAGAQSALGELAEEKNDLVRAQEHYVKAATAGEAGRAGVYQAAVKAAINYAFGKGTTRDLEKANEMLVRSKKLSQRRWTVFAHNLVEEKRLDDFAQADVEDSISTAAEEAQRRIQFAIAGSFADPKSKDYDAHEAVKWYALAADGGETWAMLELAFLYSEGRLGQPDPAKAFAWFKRAAEEKHHLLGWANLAICYQNGLGTAKDPARAAAICRDKRDEDIVCYLGSIGQFPAAIQTYDQEVQLNVSWAKKNKDSQAQYLLARRYMRGWGFKADFDDAVSWYKKSARLGNGIALEALGGLYENHGNLMGCDSWNERYKEAVACYQKAAEVGNADALADLAYCYDEGHGMAKDEDQAVALYERCLAAKPDHAIAHNNLGAIYAARCRLAQKRGPQDGQFIELREKMLRELREADRLGSETAAKNLGYLFYKGDLLKQDYQEAYGHFDTAAGRGLAEAHRMLGQMHERGEGVPVTYRDAAYHYRLAALGGDLEALRRLCDFYLTGKGVSQDYERSAFWLGLLVEKTGNVGVFVVYADALLNKGDYANAREAFEWLSDQPDPRVCGAACERLGVIFDQGLGVKPNPSKARKFREKALALGNASALYAKALDLIRGGKKAEAIPLLEGASSKGFPAASFRLGCLYCTGDGVARDVGKGMGLIRESAKAGNVDAEFSLALAALQHLPDAPEVEEAIRLAEAAEAGGHPKASSVREQLEALRQKKPSDTSSSPARPM